MKRDVWITEYWQIDLPGPMGRCEHRHRTAEAALRCAEQQLGHKITDAADQGASIRKVQFSR